MTGDSNREPLARSHLIPEDDPELLEIELLARCHHEAAHAVFAHYDGMDVGEVQVSLASGTCEILRADIYELRMPWSYAMFCLAGAYAAYVRKTLQHPKPRHLTLQELQRDALQVPGGDAWWALKMLGVVLDAEDSVFDSLGEAYAFLMMKLSKLIEERWAEIEAVAFALYDGFFGSGDEKLGRLGGVEVERIIDSVGK